jgi:hypothetical protein
LDTRILRSNNCSFASMGSTSIDRMYRICSKENAILTYGN